MVRRAALALSVPRRAKEQATLLAALDAIEASVREGAITDRPALEKAARLRNRGPAETRALREAAFWAIDAARAAEAALDFPIDAIVTQGARNALLALGEDRPGLRLQIHIIAVADIDLLAFATKEDQTQTYNGLGGHVLSRLPPVHPLADV
jgi:hypothetical protein